MFSPLIVRLVVNATDATKYFTSSYNTSLVTEATASRSALPAAQQLSQCTRSVQALHSNAVQEHCKLNKPTQPRGSAHRSATWSAGCWPGSTRRTRSTRSCGCSHTYSIASRGAIAPDASTDIATGRKRRVAIVCSYSSMPPHMRKPILLMLAQTIGLSMPSRVQHVQQPRHVHRDEAGLGAVAARARGRGRRADTSFEAAGRAAGR